MAEAENEDGSKSTKDEESSKLESLQLENQQLREISANQLRELQKVAELASENGQLKEELLETQQILTEMRIKNQRLERQVEEANETMMDEDVVERLKKKVAELEAENEKLEERQNQQSEALEYLHIELESRRAQYEKADAEKSFFLADLSALKEELDGIKRQGFSFREFVSLKKELAAVKDERDVIKAQLSMAMTKLNPSVLVGLKPLSGYPASNGGTTSYSRAAGNLSAPRSAPISRMKERQQQQHLHQQQQLQQQHQQLQIKSVVNEQKSSVSKVESRKRREGRDGATTPLTSSSSGGGASGHSYPNNPHSHLPSSQSAHNQASFKQKTSSSSQNVSQQKHPLEDFTVFGSVIGQNY